MDGNFKLHYNQIEIIRMLGKIFKRLKETRNPYLIFLIFLIFYIILVILFPTDGMSGDENRYLIYSKFIFTGTLPVHEASIDILGNGPGYSIILIPFVAFHLPLVSITIMNCFFYYFSIILLFKTSMQLVSFRNSLLISIFWGLYYNSYENLLLIVPETFTAFLICVLTYYLIKLFKQKDLAHQKKYLIFSGVIVGYLALTKPIFGYVITFMLVVGILLLIFKSKIPNYRRSVFILLIAFATCIPYLAYTYSVTGRLFYWSSFGGNNLYWMSSPFAEEYGNWLPDPEPVSDSIKVKYHYNRFEKYLGSTHDEESLNNYNIYINHKKDFEVINRYRGVERDEIYRKISLENIKNHPLKYLQNCISNIGRILYNYPYSYKLQNPGTLIRFPLNGIIISLALFCLIPTLVNWYKLLYSIRFILIFALVYLGGSIFGSAETRMFTIIIPLFLIWIIYILDHTVMIKKWFTNQNC